MKTHTGLLRCSASGPQLASSVARQKRPTAETLAAVAAVAAVASAYGSYGLNSSKMF